MCWPFPLEPTNLNKRSIKPIIRHLMRLITIFDTIQATNQRIPYIILWPIPRIYTIHNSHFYDVVYEAIHFYWHRFNCVCVCVNAICTNHSQRSMLTKIRRPYYLPSFMPHVKALFYSAHSVALGQMKVDWSGRNSERNRPFSDLIFTFSTIFAALWIHANYYEYAIRARTTKLNSHSSI